MRLSAPVPKSKPVAHTMMSNSRTPSVVSIPVSVTRTMGVSRRSTSVTFGSLKASKYPFTKGGRLPPNRWSVGIRRSAVSGSCTMPRIFSAMNPHHSSLSAWLNSRSW